MLQLFTTYLFFSAKIILHFQVAFCLWVKTSFVYKYSFENVFPLKVHQTHFHMKSFVRRLLLKQVHNINRK